MKQKKWKVYIPAILVILICAGLIAYEFYVGNGGGTEGGFEPEGERFEGNSFEEVFNWFGTAALIGGAVTYSWVRFKKKLKSPFPLLKKFSKLVFRVHNVVGYAILTFGLAHGSYYLITEKFGHEGILSGIAAFLLLLAVGTYGFLIRRLKNKYTKKVHFLVSNVSLLALLIHAGGSFIGTAAGTIAFWGAVEIAERKVLKSGA